jgi:hypothetical protein
MDKKELCEKLNKEYNPNNGKCVDPCVDGKERNPKTFRCINIKKKGKPKASSKTSKSKTAKAKKRGSPKLLSQDDCDLLEKDYNPKNNKCVDRCGAGKERNPKTFRCVNIKKKRNSKASSKSSRKPNQTECNKISRRLAELERVFKEQHPEAYAKMFAQKK